MNTKKIFGVVVLFHPDSTIIDNIHSYINSVEVLYVVDNSEAKNKTVLEKLKLFNNCIYIDNNGNQGIAHALNIGAELAIKNNADYLLTMDQDSKFNKNDIQKIVNWISNNNDTNIAMASPMHSQHEIDNYDNFKLYELLTMTSGSIVNLNIYKEIGGFKEELFIDCVDSEYCLRLASSGYKLHRFRKILLEHSCGEGSEKLGITMTNHNYIRRYYIIRNRLYLWNKYKKCFPEYIKYERLATAKEIVKIILFETDKINKFKMMFKGYFDYKNNVYGKYKG
jgi:rhamnosyltransferase